MIGIFKKIRQKQKTKFFKLIINKLSDIGGVGKDLKKKTGIIIIDRTILFFQGKETSICHVSFRSESNLLICVCVIM